MAIISSVTQTGRDEVMTVAESGEATQASGDSIEIAVDTANTHIQVGVQMFDGDGEPVVGSAGTFAVKYKTKNTEQWEAPAAATITAATPTTLSWDSNITAVQVVPTSLAGTTSWKVVVTANRN